MNRTLLITASVCCLALGIVPARPAAASGPADSLTELLQVLDPSADAVLFVPKLRQASEQFTQLMQGMDRAQLMLGSRPLDQLQSFVDITTGVDEFRGAAAIVSFDGPTRTPQELLQQTMFLLPARDPAVFRGANFELDAVDGSLKHSSGIDFFARDIGSFVLLGVDQARVEQYKPSGVLEPWFRTLGDEGFARLKQGEVVLVGHRAAAQRLTAMMPEWLPRGVGAIFKSSSEFMMQAAWPADDPAMAAVVFDFDPLAMIVRELITFDTGDMEARTTDATESLLRGMYDRPHHLALAVDLRRPATRSMLEAVSMLAGDVPLPQWARLIDDAQVMIARKAGPVADALKGGLVSDSAIVLHSTDPRALRFQLLQWLQSLGEQDGQSPARAVVEIEQNKTLATGEVVDVVAVDWQPHGDDPMHGPVKSLLLGPFGWRGYVVLRDDSVVVTLGRSAAARAKLPQSQALAGNAMVQAMLAWLPQRPAMLAFLPVSENLELARAAMAQLPFIEPVELPQPAQTLPPIGMAMDVVDRVGGAGGSVIDVIGFTTIIPAHVLTLVADEVMRSMQQQRQEQAEQDDEPLRGGES